MESLMRYIFSTTCLCFYKKVETINKVNEGPLILCGNHCLGFTDGFLLYRFSGAPIHLITAEVSMKNTLAALIMVPLLRMIPVKRQIDNEIVGCGLISHQDGKIIGEGTSFLSDIKPGYLLLNSSGEEISILKVISDTELETRTKLPDFSSKPYKILPKLTHQVLFSSVLAGLRSKLRLHISPEGKSHEKPGLLPLKSGFAYMYLSSLEEGTPCKLQTVGLNYTKQENWRSKALFVFSQPLDFSEELKNPDRKEAATNIVQKVREELENSTVSMDSYRENHCVFLAERLIRNKKPTSEEKFAKWKAFEKKFKELKEKDPKEYWEIIEDLHGFRKESNRIGVSKHRDVDKISASIFMIALLKLLLCFVLMVPGVCILKLNMKILDKLAHVHSVGLMKKQPYRENTCDYTNAMRILYAFMLYATYILSSGVLAYFATGWISAMILVWSCAGHFFLFSIRLSDAFRRNLKVARMFAGKNGMEVRSFNSWRNNLRNKLNSVLAN